MKQAAATTVAVGLLALPAGAQTLRDAVEGAWKLNPEVRCLEVQRAVATARRGAGEALVPAAPAVTLRHTSDDLNRNIGRREYEAELGVPLWLPGQGKATVRAGDALLARTDAEIARQRLKVARQLEADTRRTARAEALSVAKPLYDEELALEEARQAFRRLTGMAPPKAAPEPDIGEPPLERHPSRQAARLGVRSAQAQRQLVDLTTRDSPEVGLMARRERDSREERYDTVFDVSVRIPFAGEAVHAPKRAEALSEVVRSEAEQANATRTVESDIRQARLAHQTASKRLPTARDRAAALCARLSNIERARRAGEISFVEYVRAQEAAFEAGLATTTAEVQLGAARARMNQSLGVLP